MLNSTTESVFASDTPALISEYIVAASVEKYNREFCFWTHLRKLGQIFVSSVSLLVYVNIRTTATLESQSAFIEDFEHAHQTITGKRVPSLPHEHPQFLMAWIPQDVGNRLVHVDMTAAHQFCTFTLPASCSTTVHPNGAPLHSDLVNAEAAEGLGSLCHVHEASLRRVFHVWHRTNRR